MNRVACVVGLSLAVFHLACGTSADTQASSAAAAEVEAPSTCDLNAGADRLRAAPIAPPLVGGINWQTSSSIDSLTSAYCEGIYEEGDDDDGRPGDKMMGWGDPVGSDPSVLADFDPKTGRVHELELWGTYQGQMLMHSRENGAYGAHSYVVGVGTMTRDAQPIRINDLDNPGPVVTELYDAYLATFFPSLPAAPSDCIATKECVSKYDNGDGEGLIGFHLPAPNDIDILMDPQASTPVGFDVFVDSAP